MKLDFGHCFRTPFQIDELPGGPPRAWGGKPQGVGKAIEVLDALAHTSLGCEIVILGYGHYLAATREPGLLLEKGIVLTATFDQDSIMGLTD